MRAVGGHWQQAPDVAMQISIEVFDESRSRVLPDTGILAPDQALYPAEISGGALVQCLQQLVDRNRSFGVAGKVDRFFMHGALRKRSHVPAHNDDLLLGIKFLDRLDNQ